MFPNHNQQPQYPYPGAQFPPPDESNQQPGQYPPGYPPMMDQPAMQGYQAPPVMQGYPPMMQGYPPMMQGYPPMQQNYAPMYGYQQQPSLVFGSEQPPPMNPYNQEPVYGQMPPQPPYMAATQGLPVAEHYNQEEDDESESEESDEEEDYESDYESEWAAFRGTPTLYAVEDFDPQADAAVLRKAMKGFGTDEDAIINVLCNRSCGQRQEIASEYEKSYGKPLIDKIKSETSGKFEKLLLALLTPGAEFYCKEIKEPMSGSAKKVLVEILCTLYNNEIEAIKTTYNSLYGQELESAILGNSDSDTFRNLLVALCVANRDESGEVDIESAKIDANSLATDEDPFRYDGIFQEILCNRNFDQLRTILREFQVLTGKSFRKLIKKTFSGDELTGMMYIFRCINNKSDFFAHQLFRSMDGLGTNDQKLIRLVVTRCEIDMVEIKAAFERNFNKSLKSFIKGDCSGDYKYALYALIGEKRGS